MKPAPFYDDVCVAPAGTQTGWLKAADGVRLRMSVMAGREKGTILWFPGRAEYIEKYASATGDMLERGYSSVVIDWRGQGLSDRLLDNPRIGHVAAFSDYQKDVAALLDAVQASDLPRPLFLIAHSMGGAIGLRALIDGLPVKAVGFSAPMWGIQINGAMHNLAAPMSELSVKSGLGQRFVPGGKSLSYHSGLEFGNNKLTTDRAVFEAVQTQVATHPELSIRGPSLTWLAESLHENREVKGMDCPDIPAITFMGSNERIVDTEIIAERMQRWPGGCLQKMDSAEHEILMERPQIRNAAFDAIAALFNAQRRN
jgi:lysophospholipase